MMDLLIPETFSAYLTSTSLAVLALTLLVLYLYSHFTRLRRYGIPGPTPFPFVGNIPQILSKGFENTDAEWIKKYGKTFGYYLGHTPQVFVSDPVELKTIMIKDFPHFMDREPTKGNSKIFNNTLISMRGRRWKQTRNILTPAFSAGKLKQFFPVLNKNADTLVSNILKHDGETVEIRSFYKHFTLDCIASTAFGIEVDSQSQPDNPFVANIESLTQLTTKARLVFILANSLPTVARILQFFGYSRSPKKSIDFYERMGQMLIDDRRNNKSDNVDFITTLLEAELDASKSEMVHNGIDINGQMNGHANGRHKEKNGHKDGTVGKLTDDEINAQAFLFFLAGYETTASLLRYVSYVLALYPDIDEKVYEEIKKKIGDDTPSYEQIASLTYMDMVIDEVLRFYPPVTRVHRRVDEDIHVGDKMIPKDTTIVIPIWYIHHHPDYYPDPEKIIPERFSPEMKAANKVDGITYLPFGQGPRHCIGMRLALVEAKLALVHVLRKVKFAKSEKTQVPLALSHFGLLRPKEDVYVKVEKR